MPATYKGLTVPVSTDKADGPAAFRDYTDTLPTSEALQAYNTGSLGPFRVFPTTTEMNAWAAPTGSLASVVADGNLYKRTTTAWVRAVPDDPVPPTLPKGALAYSAPGSTVAIGASAQDVNLLAVGVGTLIANRSVLVSWSCLCYEASGGNATKLRLAARVAVGATNYDQILGSVSVSDTAVAFGVGVYFSGVSVVKVTQGGSGTVTIFADNLAANGATIGDRVLKAAEV